MRTLGGLRNQENGEGLWQRLPCREAGRILERAGHTETVVGKHIVIVGGRKGCAVPHLSSYIEQSESHSLLVLKDLRLFITGTSSTMIGYAWTHSSFAGTVDSSTYLSRQRASLFPRTTVSSTFTTVSSFNEDKGRNTHCCELRILTCPFLCMQARAYHSAVRCGTKVWVIGGSDLGTIFSDIWVLDTITLSWEEVSVR